MFGYWFLFDVNVAWHACKAKIGDDKHLGSVFKQSFTSHWHVGDDNMDELPGTLGTSASLALRLGQSIFSVASLLFMCLDVPFYSFTSFCYLVTVMGLVMAWSLTLAMVDAFSILIKLPSRQAGIVSLVVLGDWVLSFLSLAASCSTASSADYLIQSRSSFCKGNLCTRYQLSAAMALLAWFLTFASSLFNLWLLPSLYPE